MNNKICVITILLLFITNFAYSKETKIAKINLSLLASLHPKMAVFDFYRIGFYRVPFGLSFDEKSEWLNKEKKTGELREEAQKQIVVLEKSISDKEDEVYKLKLKEKTGIVEDMSEDGKTKFNELNSEITKLILKRDKAQWTADNPDLTTYDETRTIIQNIEKELIDAVNQAAKSGEYDVVLNASIPVPYGYPVKYKKEVLYSRGPIGMAQSTYYSVLSERPYDRASELDSEAALKDWISITSRPDTQDMLPIKPWPLVMQGGHDLLPEALEIIYKNNNIDDETYKLVLNTLYKIGSLERE